VSFENMAKLNVLARNCEVDEALQTHFEEKLDSLERVWPRADEAVVRLSHERGRYAAEITLVSGGMLTRGEERAANLRQAFDAAVEKLEAQLRRYKKKATSQARRHDNRDDVAGTVINSSLPAAGIAPDGISTNATAAVQAAPLDNGRSAADDDGDTYDDSDEDVVRVKRFALKPMSVQEAALQMGLLGHSFFVFRDAQNNQVSVVYRRRDGGYGLIEPVAD
jgi:putative sigma-54 modulation protein